MGDIFLYLDSKPNSKLAVMSPHTGEFNGFQMQKLANSTISRLLFIAQFSLTPHQKAYSKCHFMRLIDLIFL